MSLSALSDTLADSTGKERDAETGLDFFLARYYSGAQGRFLSPDEFKGGPDDALTGAELAPPGPLPYADINNPQTLNKYAYVINNPLRYTDPDGHFLETAWDAVSLGIGVASFVSNVKQANLGAAILDGVGVVLDGAAVIAPGVPGGVGAGIKALRGGDKVVDGIKAINGVDDVTDTAKATKKAFITTPEGATLPPNQDFNLVSTSAGKKGDFLQIHGTHADKGAKPHTHTPEVHTNPATNQGRTVRTDRPTTSQDINRADRELRNGTMRQRQNRNDIGD